MEEHIKSLFKAILSSSILLLSLQGIAHANVFCDVSAEYRPRDPNAIPGNQVVITEALNGKQETKSYDLVYDFMKSDRGAVYIRQEGDRLERIKKAKVYIVLLHGVGADYSNPTSMLHQYENYSGYIPPEKARSLAQEEIAKHNFPLEDVYIEILPLTGSTFGGTPHERVKNMKIYTRPITEHIKEVKKINPNIVVAGHGRSYGSTTLAAISHRNPGLFDKLTLVALGLTSSDNIKKNTESMKEHDETDSNLVLDWAWLKWADRILMQEQWWKLKAGQKAFGGARTLIYVGERDWQVNRPERRSYHQMAFDNPNVRFEIVPDLEHDATSTNTKQNTIARVAIIKNIESLYNFFSTTDTFEKY